MLVNVNKRAEKIIDFFEKKFVKCLQISEKAVPLHRNRER